MARLKNTDMMTELETFNRLKRSPFDVVMQEIDDINQDADLNDDLRSIFKKHHWTAKEYLTEGWDKLHTEEQADYVLEDNVRLVQQIVEMFPQLYDYLEEE